jgi:integrase
MLKEMGYHPGRPCRTVSQAVAGAFLLALRTGMRAGEICGLTWDRVKPDYCILLETKTVPRDVPLVQKSVHIIEQQRGWDDVMVFGLTTATLDALFRKYRQRAGLSGFTFHDSRHTAATWIAPQIDVLTLCKIMGWKNTS